MAHGYLENMVALHAPGSKSGGHGRAVGTRDEAHHGDHGPGRENSFLRDPAPDLLDEEAGDVRGQGEAARDQISIGCKRGLIPDEGRIRRVDLLPSWHDGRHVREGKAQPVGPLTLAAREEAGHARPQGDVGDRGQSA